MKRVISLFLALALLFSLVPAVFAEGNEQAGVALVIGTPEKKTATDYETNEQVVYYRVPVKVQNKTSETVTINAAECYIRYDETNFSCGDIQIGESDYVDAYEYNSATTKEWNKQPSASNGLVTMGLAANQNQSRYFLKIKSNSEAELFAINLKRASDIENGDYALTLAEPFEAGGNPKQNLIGNKIEEKFYTQKDGSLDCTSKETISVTDGKAPTLDSVTISPEATTVFASGKDFTLSAKSASGKDITSLVTFKIQKDEADFPANAGLTIAGNKLTVESSGSLANVGTYTVVATPNGDGCTGSASAVFTITPKTITNPTVTVSGFGKGLPVTGATATADNMTVARGWYTGEGVPSEANAATGNFAADSPYTLTLQLIPNKNYKLADDLTVTVRGLGDDQVIKHASNPLIVKARTTAKDATKRASGTNLFADSSRYGNTLSSVNLTAEANKDGYLVVAYIDGQETTTKVPGEFKWESPNDKVGDVGSNKHWVVFTPDKPFDEQYAGFRVEVTVRVDKKVLNLDETKLTWSKTNLTYTGEEQTVTATPTADIAEYVNVTYDNETEGHTNTAINAGSYTAAAVVTPKDANNISLGGETEAEQNSRTFTKDWTIANADLNPTAAAKNVRFGTNKTVVVTPADFGLDQNGVEITSAVVDSTADDRLILNAAISVDQRSVTFTLKDTSKTDADSKLSGTATLKFAAENYNETTGTTLTINIIDKESQTLTVTGPASFPYGTTEDAIKSALTITGLPTGYDASKVTYTFSNSDISAAAPAEGYTVTVGYEDDNFLYTGTYTFEITARSIADADVTFKALTYNGSEQTTEITVKIGEKTLTMGTDYTVTGDLKGTDAGEYPVTVTGTGNYAGTLTPKFTIAKATPTAAAFTFTAPANLTYDGNPKTADVTANNTEIGAVTVSYAPADPTNAGTYTVKISTAETTNYKAATNLTDAAWTFTIAPATILDTMVGSIGDLTYTGEALTPAPSVASLTAGTDYEVTYANNTNAGTATATVTGKGNYEGTIVRNFTIKPASMNFVKEVYVSRHTNVRTEQTITLQSITGVKGETLTPSVTLEAPSSADDIFTVHPAYNAETGNVTFTLNGTAGSATYKVKLASPNSNYAPGEYNLVFTASHRTAIAITFEDGSATYTSSPIRYENASAGESGTWTYTYVPVEGSGASLDAVTSLPLTVGTYKVTAHFENADHIGDKTVTFVITKATPATPPEIKVDGGDKKLSDLEAGMRAAMGGIGGTFEWYDSNGNRLESTTKIEANTEYRWKFIPADPNNYNSIEGTTTPYVRDDLSWLPGVLGGGSSFSFHDVTRFDYYYDSVKWAADNGIASGTSRFAFSPDAVCTRAQTVTFLWRAAGSPLPRYRVSPFTDVHSYDYYYEAVLWAVEQGITTGLTATTFGPDETVTRGQVATFLYRAASAAKPNTFNPFTDVKPTAYNYGAILWAYDNRITTGTSTTTFSPDAFCTRAQIVTFLYRYYQGR